MTCLNWPLYNVVVGLQEAEDHIHCTVQGC